MYYLFNLLFLQTLYTYPENFRAYKALIAAQYAGANVKIAPNFVFGETNKQESFLKKFPAGKVSKFFNCDRFVSIAVILPVFRLCLCHTWTQITYTITNK